MEWITLIIGFFAGALYFQHCIAIPGLTKAMEEFSKEMHSQYIKLITERDKK